MKSLCLSQRDVCPVFTDLYPFFEWRFWLWCRFLTGFLIKNSQPKRKRKPRLFIVPLTLVPGRSRSVHSIQLLHRRQRNSPGDHRRWRLCRGTDQQDKQSQAGTHTQHKRLFYYISIMTIVFFILNFNSTFNKRHVFETTALFSSQIWLVD